METNLQHATPMLMIKVVCCHALIRCDHVGWTAHQIMLTCALWVTEAFVMQHAQHEQGRP